MWWATSRWWRQTTVWAVLLGGLLTAMLWLLPAVLAGVEGARAELDLVEAAAQFAELATVVTAAGAVILSQGLLLDDQRGGLLEWLLSKPLSRPALLLAKLAGHTSGLLAAVVALPWLAVWALLSVAGSAVWPAGRVAGTVALVALVVAFHAALVLALSVVTASRGVVLAVPLALLVAGDLVVTAAPWTAHVSPYLLARLAAGVLATGELMAVWPVVATMGWTLLLVVVAVWRFQRQEL